MKKAILWIVLLGGIGVIVTTFLCFDLGFATDDVRYLSLAVAILAYSLFFVDLLTPWVNWSDKSHKSIAGLGLRWSSIFFYAIAAVIAIVAMNYYDLSFTVQAIVHAILLLGLLLGVVGMLSATSITGKVYQQEQAMRRDIVDLKGAVLRLKVKMAGCELPEDITNRLRAWEESLRYISPSKSAEAHEIEKQMSSEIDNLGRMVGDYTLNEERILKSISTLERLYVTRKSLY